MQKDMQTYEERGQICFGIGMWFDPNTMGYKYECEGKFTAWMPRLDMITMEDEKFDKAIEQIAEKIKQYPIQ